MDSQNRRSFFLKAISYTGALIGYQVMIGCEDENETIDIWQSEKIPFTRFEFPAKGSSLCQGEEYTIIWKTNVQVPFNVNLYWQSGDNPRWVPLAKNVAILNGSFDWVPAPEAQGLSLLKMEAAGSNKLLTTSQTFWLRTPGIKTFWGVEEGRRYFTGDSLPLFWEAYCTGRLTIEYRRSRVDTWKILKSDIDPALGQMEVTIPETPSNTAEFRLRSTNSVLISPVFLILPQVKIDLDSFPALKEIGGMQVLDLPLFSKLSAVRISENTFKVIELVCTHAGCEVNIFHSDKTWECPCHGSRFTPAGCVINGPATKPLEELESEYLAHTNQLKIKLIRKGNAGC